MYSAARDYLHVVQHCPNDTEAYVGLIQCLVQLKWVQEASDWLEYFCKVHPECISTKQVKNIGDDILSLKNSDNKKEDGEEHQEKALSDEEKQLRLESRDYESRYLGHCNTTTDIKEANFLGK